MFDIGWPELMVIAVVALVAIGPKDLPFALRTIGRFVAKARTMARDFQTHVDDMVREAELDELRKKATEIRDTVDIKKHVQNAIDPSGSVELPPDRLTVSGMVPATETVLMTAFGGTLGAPVTTISLVAVPVAPWLSVTVRVTVYVPGWV